MRKTVYILILLISIVISGCRTNNGDIGLFYGQWSLKSITVDGTEADVDCSRYFFRFQNNIVCITEEEPFNNYINSFGTWEQDANTLWLNFTHVTGDGDISGFTLPEELLLPETGLIPLELTTLSARIMVLTYTRDDGGVQVYSLAKLQ